MKDDKRLKRKVRNSYRISTLSLSLVLFLLGSVGYLIGVAMKLAHTLQEQVTVMVELEPEAAAEEVEALREMLHGEALVRSVAFSSREEKASDADFRALFEQEFEVVLEENPLRDSFELQLTADSESGEQVEALISLLESQKVVERVSYPARMAERMHRTVGKIRFVLLLFGGALLLVSLVLLSNTIRLAIFSKRYLINTMKLVGATKWYIMRPFLGESVMQGVWAGLVATLLFGGAAYGLTEAIPELTTLTALEEAAVIAATMVLSGILLSLLFTWVAVNRFVNMKSSKIYLY